MPNFLFKILSCSLFLLVSHQYYPDAQMKYFALEISQLVLYRRIRMFMRELTCKILTYIPNRDMRHRVICTTTDQWIFQMLRWTWGWFANRTWWFKYSITSVNSIAQCLIWVKQATFIIGTQIQWVTLKVRVSLMLALNHSDIMMILQFPSSLKIRIVLCPRLRPVSFTFDSDPRLHTNNCL